MKDAVEPEKSADPPFQLEQLLHSTFDFIIPPLTPDPSRSVILAAELYSGSTLPVPNRGETVTFWPSDEVYMTKILAPAISDP